MNIWILLKIKINGVKLILEMVQSLIPMVSLLLEDKTFWYYSFIPA
uniref:Uncharacterized protein n=1 Tax=Meloidogyne enterolobii TaxID=390850 RepID=A0A6V7W4V1_MELEN|nr:unnamed protein product [Meloidogyne enterolobii]